MPWSRAILSVTGQVPFGFTSVLKIDLETPLHGVQRVSGRIHKPSRSRTRSMSCFSGSAPRTKLGVDDQPASQETPVPGEQRPDLRRRSGQEVLIAVVPTLQPAQAGWSAMHNADPSASPPAGHPKTALSATDYDNTAKAD